MNIVKYTHNIVSANVFEDTLSEERAMKSAGLTPSVASRTGRCIVCDAQRDTAVYTDGQGTGVEVRQWQCDH